VHWFFHKFLFVQGTYGIYYYFIGIGSNMKIIVGINPLFLAAVGPILSRTLKFICLFEKVPVCKILFFPENPDPTYQNQPKLTLKLLSSEMDPAEIMLIRYFLKGNVTSGF
jgi:hypothetical protein